MVSVGTRLNGLKQDIGLANISRGFEYLYKTTPGVYPGEMINGGYQRQQKNPLMPITYSKNETLWI